MASIDELKQGLAQIGATAQFSCCNATIRRLKSDAQIGLDEPEYHGFQNTAWNWWYMKSEYPRLILQFKNKYLSRESL
jgi:hypothetical protein